MIHETPDVSVVRAEAHVRACAGFSVLPSTAGDDRAEIQELHAHLARWGLQTRVRHRREKASAGVRHRFFLDLVDVSQELIAELDTAALTRELAKLNSDSHSSVEAEIWLAWLVSPGLLEFPSFAELFAQFRIRCAIVDGASKTLVDFHAHAVNRPASHWTYIEDVGFRLNAGKPLLEGLRLALHPETPEKRYAFSCYRASEYVLLLGLAGEAERSNPALFSAIEAQWLQGPLMAARFEAAFLSPVGTAEHPLPKRWYVPGDRSGSEIRSRSPAMSPVMKGRLCCIWAVGISATSGSSTSHSRSKTSSTKFIVGDSEFARVKAQRPGLMMTWSTWQWPRPRNARGRWRRLSTRCTAIVTLIRKTTEVVRLTTGAKCPGLYCRPVAM